MIGFILKNHLYTTKYRALPMRLIADCTVIVDVDGRRFIKNHVSNDYLVFDFVPRLFALGEIVEPERIKAYTEKGCL
jgi:hypothetical protein